MNIYEVMHLVKNQDNMDKIADILDQWFFQTSFHSPEVKKEIGNTLPTFFKMGETDLYAFIKNAYGIK
jgi:hypothetical protein